MSVCATMVASSLGCGTTQPRVLPEAYSQNNGEAAAAVAGAGVVLYAVAGGCRSAGCPSDLRCNPESERCERVPCNPGNAATACGATSQCNPGTGTCVSF